MPTGIYVRKPRKSLAERFWAKVIRNGDDECWGWNGATTEDGYGVIGKGRRDEGSLKASRASWLIHHGEVPADKAVLHKCDNPPCTNPRHLFLGSLLENNIDKGAKGRQAKGETAYAKLTGAQVKEIKARYKAGGISQYDLAAEYKVSRSLIGAIVAGQRWSHLK